MTAIAGDAARVSILVAVEPAAAFEIFTTEIDQWWRRGPKYRIAGSRRGVMILEPQLGGRLFESYDSAAGPKVVETGRVTAWEPPARVVFEWRTSNFAPNEKTEVEVTFAASPSGTQVTVTHRGWSQLRPDHPVRHGQTVPAFIRAMGLWWGELMTSMREHAARVRGA